MARSDHVLAVLASVDDRRPFGPVQVQKLFFVIDREVPEHIGGPKFSFRPYDYGPFDRSVYDELDILSSRGFVMISRGNGHSRQYCLTPDGWARGRELLGRYDPKAVYYFRQVAEWVTSLSFSSLVSAIYAKYPEMKARSIFRA